MTVRRLNYTHRKRIARDHISIALSQEDSRPLSFSAEVDLAEYSLPEHALVFLEARRQTRFMRFALGTVGNITLPDNRILTVFDSTDGVQFRLVVTSPGPRRGLILAEADRVFPVTPESGGARVPLLPVRGDDTLGQRVWKLDFTNGPLLLINRSGVEWKTLAGEPAFQSLVYPAVVRQVLTQVAAEGGGETDPPSEWKGYWLAFAQALNPDLPPPDDLDDWQAVDEWVEEVVLAFSKHNELFTKFLGTRGEVS